MGNPSQHGVISCFQNQHSARFSGDAILMLISKRSLGRDGFCIPRVSHGSGPKRALLGLLGVLERHLDRGIHVHVSKKRVDSLQGEGTLRANCDTTNVMV